MSNRLSLDRLWGVNGEKRDPGNNVYSLGWINEIPTYQVINFLQYKNDLAILSLAERDVAEWGADISYKNKALAWDETDGQIYTALVANPNTSLRPSANPAQWARSAVHLTKAELDEINSRINSHIANKVNPHNVTAAQLNVYTKPQADAAIKVTQDDLDAHKALRNNPHEVTAAQAGAVPITGGTYSGIVTFSQAETKINPGAGDAAVKSNSTGTYLRNGTDHLGIEGGEPVFNSETLLPESEYLVQRELYEPEFATPEPDFEMDLATSIHIIKGFGTSRFTRPGNVVYTDKSGVSRTATTDVPAFTKQGFQIGNLAGQSLIVDGALNFQGFSVFTIFTEFYANSGSSTYLWSTNGVEVRRLEAAGGNPRFTLVDTVGTTHTLALGPLANGVLCTAALTYDGTTAIAYRDGVEVSRKTLVLPSSVYDQLIMGTPSGGLAWMRNIRTWASVLTPNQISTL